MSLKKPTTKYTEACLEPIKRLRLSLDESEAVVIGAGAGLSVSAGFLYSGKRFHDNFNDFEMLYGFQDMYSGGFYPYETPEEYWAYWSRYIYINRYQDAPKPVYNDLFQLVKDKDYFVITTNVDHCFQKAGFDKKRLFYTQGDFGLFQCSGPCCQKTYDNEEAIRQMIKQQKAMRIPAELKPCCPVCGRPMSMNLRTDETFVEDKGWHRAAKRYSEFLQRHRTSKVLFLELGTGMSTPGIIKLPFWKMTDQWPNATYACVNRGEAYAPPEIESKAVCINEDIGGVLKNLQREIELTGKTIHDTIWTTGVKDNV